MLKRKLLHSLEKAESADSLDYVAQLQLSSRPIQVWSLRDLLKAVLDYGA